MDRVGPDEFSGFELADYEESIQSAITASLKGSGGDLMPYFSEQRTPGVKAKVLSAIPSVELRDGELMGCTTVRLKEPLNDVEMKALQEYLRGQFSDGWGEGFEQWEIYTEDGTLYVHFWNEDSFSFEAVPVQATEPTKEPPVPKRPKMKLAGMDGNIFFTVAAEMDTEACAKSVNEARNKGAFVMGAESMDINNLLTRSQHLAQGKGKDGDK